MNPGDSILEKSDAEILAIAHQLRVAYKMKRTLRYGTTRDFAVHSESVAEHVFALIFLATYFLPLEEVGTSLDKVKIYEILLYHDFGEIIHGDVLTYHKTETDREREAADAKKVFASLPASLQKVGYERWCAYEEQTCPEARFAYALDKVEPVFELLDPINELSVKRFKITYLRHLGHKLEAAEAYPVMKRFANVISNDMRERGVFWPEK
ncbi:MAG: HD domain-containing protein [Minisyncoccia bacterium]|jgi:putative hydrolase of HD superfamily